MLSCTRWLKVGYVVALGTALGVLLWKPAPIQAQRSLAYPFLPGAGATAAAMAGVLAAGGTPLTAYGQVQNMLAQAGQPLDPFGVGMSGGVINGVLGGGGGAGLGGGNLGAGGIGGAGGLGGLGGMGGAGGFRGMGGMGGGPGGMGGGMAGMGGMGGFAGKGMGGFNGKKPL
jgi:hypothetical protein